jgi:hypothetical protein
MDDSRKTPQTDSVRRLRAARRAARGVVAGYIHELSARHESRKGGGAGGPVGPAATGEAAGRA